MLSEEQRRAFHELGYLRLEGVLDRHEVSAMRDRLWRQLERNGARPDDPATWAPGAATHLQRVRRGDPDPDTDPVVTDALDDLIEPGAWSTGRHWGQALVTFPTPEPWTLPHGPWHLDHPYTYPLDQVRGLNLFLLTGDLGPRGGATLVVEGSPVLTRRFVASLPDGGRSGSQKQLRKAFDARHEYFRALSDPDDDGDRVGRFLERTTEVDGVPVRVVELTGRAGDVYLCHPWTIHNGAPNVADRPRMMRACRVYHRDVVAARRRH